MTVEDSVSSMAPPALVVRTKGAVRTLWPGRSYQVGRDPAADVPMDDDRVSWRHGVLRTDEHGWSFEDVGSMVYVVDGRGRVIARSGSGPSAPFDDLSNLPPVAAVLAL